MKIAFITPNYVPMNGGTQVAVHALAVHLINKGHEVMVVTPADLDTDDFGPNDGVPLYAFKIHRGRFSFSCSNLSLLFSLGDIIKGFDIVHQFHVLRFGMAVMLYSRWNEKPLVTTLMGTDTYDPLCKKNRRRIDLYSSCILNGSSAVTSPSYSLSDHAKRQGCKKEIQIIPHGIDPERYKLNATRVAKLRESICGARGPRRIILAVQRLHPVKGIDILIRALAILVFKYGIKDVLLLIAGDGPDELRLKKQAHDLNVLDHIDFCGYISRDRIPDYYHCCDIFALHTMYEAFGIVLAEAMICGKPIVATLAGAIPEIVKNGTSGFLVPPNDPESFAHALKRLLDDEPLSKALGTSGKNAIADAYNWSVIADKYLQLYNKILRQPF